MPRSVVLLVWRPGLIAASSCFGLLRRTSKWCLMSSTGILLARWPPPVHRLSERSTYTRLALVLLTESHARLPGIKKLFDQKWAKIMALSIPFIDGAVQIAADNTEGDESEDHRGLIQISDDSDNEAAIKHLHVLAAISIFLP
ncbi:hypothetical protein C8R44DRAFT_750988 [Mycena epipterygia]|nr:hypothetical protein C8R44DRAFT_750988 [Mycena epipterygia]